MPNNGTAMIIQNCLKLLEDLTELEERIKICRENYPPIEAEKWEELLLKVYAQSRGK